MPTFREIADQQARLDQHRANVATLLEQIAGYGGPIHAPLNLRNTLVQNRTEIARVKAILRGWGVEVADHPDDEASAAPVAAYPGQALHQLRAPVADFVGRDEAVDTLVAALRLGPGGRAAAISGVRGMGGIGKTELAHAVAAHLQADYPDAQLLLELRGASDAPLSSEQALQQVIQAFRPEENLPEELSALQALYRSVLAGRRVLILADDAKDVAQVRPLLPPVGCALLVTSRQRLLLDGMVVLDLERLEEGAAVQFLCGICSRLDESQARQIARLCGGLPLALRVSAGILASNPSRSVARYLTQLTDERQVLAALRAPNDPERDVAATLRLSYAALDQATQQQFRRLGVLAADADLELIAALLELSPAQAEVTLELLHRHSLVEYDVARERWGLHDLVRVFMLERLSEAGETYAARLRYADQVLRVIAQAEQRYQAGGAGVQEGLARFDQERAHREAVRLWLWTQPFAPEIDALIWDEAFATLYIEELRDAARAVRVPRWNQAVGVAKRRGDRRGEGSALRYLGIIYRGLGEVQTAIDCYQQGLVIMREVGDRTEEGATLGNLGNAYLNLGEAHRAIDYYQQHLAIALEVGDQRRERMALGNLGKAYLNLGETHRAIGYLEQRLIIARELGDRHGEGTALTDLGNAYLNLGETRTAISYYEQRLAIARELGDRLKEGIALGNLGGAYLNLGETRRAISYYEQRLTIAQEIGDQGREGIALGGLGEAYLNLGETHTAISYYEQRLAIARERGKRRGQGVALGGLGDAYLNLGETRRAISYYEQQLAIVQETGSRRREGVVLGNLGDAYLNLGETRRAISYYEQYLAIARELSNRRREGWALGNLGAAYIQLGDAVRALSENEMALHLAQTVGDQRLEGRVLCDLGAARALLDQHAEADAHYQQSLTLLDRLDLQTDAARTRWAYGQFLMRQGSHERGIELMAECVAYEQRIGHVKADEHAALVDSLRAGGELPSP